MGNDCDQFSLEKYDFGLPKELIAQHPVEPRDESRLLVVNRSNGQISETQFSSIGEFLKPGDLLVANNSKVIPARLLGARPETGGKIEFLLLGEIEPNVWRGLMRSSARINVGFRFEVSSQNGGSPLIGVVIEGGREPVVRFNKNPLIDGFGSIPLPPYIRGGIESVGDRDSYQTVFAKTPGSSAAPTAGLHFTSSLIDSIKNDGIEWEEATLHIGLGTFRPLQSEDIRNHQMHSERYEISAELSEKLLMKLSRQARGEGEDSRIIAVGTTSLRTIESAALKEFAPGLHETDIYFYPGAERKFTTVGGLVTNFHLPKSSLYLLVCAFAGSDLMTRAYQYAIENRFRFYSYGDAMLII